MEQFLNQWANWDDIDISVGDLLEYTFDSFHVRKIKLYYLILEVNHEKFTSIAYNPLNPCGFKAKKETFCFPIQKNLYKKTTLDNQLDIQQQISMDLDSQIKSAITIVNDLNGLKQQTILLATKLSDSKNQQCQNINSVK